jgi:hypothetical protein
LLSPNLFLAEILYFPASDALTSSISRQAGLGTAAILHSNIKRLPSFSCLIIGF